MRYLNAVILAITASLSTGSTHALNNEWRADSIKNKASASSQTTLQLVSDTIFTELGIHYRFNPTSIIPTSPGQPYTTTLTHLKTIFASSVNTGVTDSLRSSSPISSGSSRALLSGENLALVSLESSETPNGQAPKGIASITPTAPHMEDSVARGDETVEFKVAPQLDGDKSISSLFCSGKDLFTKDIAGVCMDGNFLWYSGKDFSKHCKCDDKGKISCDIPSDCGPEEDVIKYCSAGPTFTCTCLADSAVVNVVERQDLVVTKKSFTNMQTSHVHVSFA